MWTSIANSFEVQNRLLEAKKPGLCAFVGDNYYPNGGLETGLFDAWRDWADHVHTAGLDGQTIVDTPTIALIGNHDYEGWGCCGSCNWDSPSTLSAVDGGWNTFFFMLDTYDPVVENPTLPSTRGARVPFQHTFVAAVAGTACVLMVDGAWLPSDTTDAVDWAAGQKRLAALGVQRVVVCNHWNGANLGCLPGADGQSYADWLLHSAPGAWSTFKSITFVVAHTHVNGPQSGVSLSSGAALFGAIVGGNGNTCNGTCSGGSCINCSDDHCCPSYLNGGGEWSYGMWSEGGACHGLYPGLEPPVPSSALTKTLMGAGETLTTSELFEVYSPVRLANEANYRMKDSSKVVLDAAIPLTGYAPLMLHQLPPAISHNADRFKDYTSTFQIRAGYASCDSLTFPPGYNTAGANCWSPEGGHPLDNFDVPEPPGLLCPASGIQEGCPVWAQTQS